MMMWHKRFTPQWPIAFSYKHQDHFGILIVNYTNTNIIRKTRKICAEHGDMLSRPLQVC